MRGFFNFKQILLISFYLLAAWIAVALIAYGLAWRRVGQTPRNLVQPELQIFNGPVEYVRSRGFGPLRDYEIKLTNSKETIFVPGAVLNPVFEGKRSIPVDLVAEFRTVKGAHIQAIPGERPVAVGILVRPETGVDHEILKPSGAMSRLQELQGRSLEIGERIILLGLLILPIAGVLHWLLLLTLRRVQRKSA